MQVSKIKIENFRSIKSEVIEFESLTLLVGSNDHGKSNILRAVDAFFNARMFGERTIQCPGFYRQNKRRDSGSSPLRVSMLFTDLPPGLRHTKQRLSTIAISMQFFADESVRFSINSPNFDRPSARHNLAAHEKYRAIKKHLNVSYIPSFRNIESELNPFADRSVLYTLLSTYLMASVQRSHGGKTFEYRKIKKVRESIDGLMKESFDELKHATAKYLPSAYGKPEFEFSFIGRQNDETRDQIVSQIISRNTHLVNSAGVEIRELGSGIQQAAMIGLIEKTCISKSKHNVLLLEEPETFLHPNAQRELYVKLCELAKRPSTQILFTSHSPAILDATELRNVAVVRKQFQKTPVDGETHVLQIPKRLTAVESRNLETVETKKLFDNSEVFFSELVVLVEGFSDELVLREALKKLKPELLYRVAIVTCGGNSKFLTFSQFLRSFKSTNGNHLESVFIADKDTLLREQFENLRVLSPGANWEEAKSVASRTIGKDSAGFLNRNTSALVSRKINKTAGPASVFFLEADIEFALVNESNLKKVESQIRKFHDKGNSTLEHFKGRDEVARLLGSTGPNSDWQLDQENRKRWKRPELHKAIAGSFNSEDFSSELHQLVNWIGDRFNRIQNRF